MIDPFIKYLQFEKRVSPHTLSSYQTDLTQFSEFISSTFETEPKDATFAMIRSWIVDLAEKKLENSSVNRKIACLRSFFKFLLKQEVIKKDPMMKVRVLKTRKKLPSFVKETEINNLLDNVTFEDSFEGMRDKVVLELLYGTGIRRSELLNLKEKAIDFAGQTIKVLGKRNKERVIPFSDGLKQVIKNYVARRNREVSRKSDEFLLVTADGSKCYPVLINRIVRKYLGLYTASEKTNPHVLRHSYATHLLNKGAEINAVKDLLGHSSLAATQVYTHNSLEKIKKVFDQAHPKA